MGMTAFVELLHWLLTGELPTGSLKLLRISFSQGCMKSPVLLFLSFFKHQLFTLASLVRIVLMPAFCSQAKLQPRLSWQTLSASGAAAA